MFDVRGTLTETEDSVRLPRLILLAGFLTAASLSHAQTGSPTSVSLKDSGQSFDTTSTYQIALDDLDGDGDLDAVIAIGDREATFPTSVLMNDGQGRFSETEQTLPEAMFGRIILGDGDVDAFEAVFVNGSNRVWFNEREQEGQIAFYSQRDGNAEIYVMNDNGTSLLRLTQNDADDVTPAWSPDGSHIAIQSDRDGNDEIYVMNADGDDPRRLTNSATPDRHPSWSPDGTQIVFQSTRDGNGEIYVMDADGSNQKRLTDNAADEMRPGFSPDGATIVFNSNRDGNYEIYTMHPDGSDQTRLTDTELWEIFPVWSPDGSQIAYAMVDIEVHESDIQVMNMDDGTIRILTDTPGVDEDPAWSPDGSEIVFQSNRDGNYEIYRMKADGSDQRRLTTNPAGDYWPDWIVLPQSP